MRASKMAAAMLHRLRYEPSDNHAMHSRGLGKDSITYPLMLRR